MNLIKDIIEVDYLLNQRIRVSNEFRSLEACLKLSSPASVIFLQLFINQSHFIWFLYYWKSSLRDFKESICITFWQTKCIPRSVIWCLELSSIFSKHQSLSNLWHRFLISASEMLPQLFIRCSHNSTYYHVRSRTRVFKEVRALNAWPSFCAPFSEIRQLS